MKAIYDKCMLLLDSGLKKTVNEFIKKYDIPVTLDKNFIRLEVEKMLRQAGFVDTTVHFAHKLPDGTESGKAFVYGNLYCRIDFFKNKDTSGTLKDWVVLEYAHNLHEAQHHLYEDGVAIPLDVKIEILLAELRSEVQKTIL